MSGYTPLFHSITTGTLCGRWPDIGLWPLVLSLADRNGVVDVTPDYISRITGLDLSEVVACLGRFCEPDRYSRSQVEDGRRLVLLDPARAWGWRVVNHSKYRDKARKMAYDANRTESGADAARKQTERATVPTCPDVSRDVPSGPALHTPDSYSNKEQEGEKTRGVIPCGDALTRIPGGEAWRDVEGINAEAFARWLQVAEERGKVWDGAGRLALAKWLAGYGGNQASIVEQSVRSGWKNLRELEKTKRSNSVVDRLTWRPAEGE